MKRNTRAISLIALMLALIQAVSCGGGTIEPTVITQGSDTDTSSEVTTEPSAYTPPDVDYSGKTFTVFEDHIGGYVISNYNYFTSEAENGDVINDAIFKRTQAVEEALGVKIKVVKSESTGNYTQLINSINAGDDEYKSIMTHMSQANKLLGSGLLYDLRSIGTLDLESDWVNQDANEEYEISGKQYLMIDSSCVRTLLSSGVIYFNKQMVNEYKLDDPYKLVDDGSWTLDTFAAMAKQVSDDINGDGKMDENDRFGFSGSSTVLKQTVTSCGLRITTKDKSGVPELTLNSERTITMIDKMNAILNDFTVNAYPDNFKGNGDTFLNVLLPMFKSDRLFMNFNWLFYALELRDMETDFGILPMPKFDEKQEKYYSQLSDWWADMIAVPASVSDPDMVGHVLNAMGYYSELYVYPELVSRAVSTKSMRDEDSARMIDIVNDGLVFDLWFIYKWGNLINAVTGTLGAGTNNFSSAYASLEAKTNEEIAKTFESLK